MNSREMYTACSALVTGVAVFVAACRQPEPTDDRPITVLVVKAERGSVSERLELAAELRPYQEVDLRSRVAGQVDEILVDVGDAVGRGQRIATLKVPESRSELAEAVAARKRSQQEALRYQSDVERTQAELEAAQLVYSRLSTVFQANPNLIARQEVDDALARVRVADAELAAAKAGLSAAHEQVRAQAANEARARTLADYSIITAPIAGLITRRYADIGSMIQGSSSQGQAIVQLSQVDRLRLALPIPESVVPTVDVGRDVQVTVPALEKTFEGRLARLSGQIDAATRTMEAEVDVPNPRMVLRPGMSAVVEFDVARRDRALTLPVQAVSRNEDVAAVMLVNAENRIEPRTVVTGIETPTVVEIASGLAEHDRVVIGSHSQLRPGQRVIPKDAPAGRVREGN